MDRRELERMLRELGWFPTGGTKGKRFLMWKHPHHPRKLGVPELDILKDADGQRLLEFARKGGTLK